jgi:hypothetical protein
MAKPHSFPTTVSEPLRSKLVDATGWRRQHMGASVFLTEHAGSARLVSGTQSTRICITQLQIGVCSRRLRQRA